MKKTSSILACFLGLFFVAATAEEYKLEYVPLDPASMGVQSSGQYMMNRNSPGTELGGVPEIDEGKKWFFDAKLGEGENNTLHFMALIPEGNGQVWLYFDKNRDGDLSDEKPCVQAVKDSRVTFPPMDLTISVKGVEMPYRASIMGYLFDGNPSFSLQSKCCRKGKIAIDGDTYEAALIDGNANGLFAETDWNADSMVVATDLNEHASSYLWKSSNRVVIKDGAWHYFEPAPDGTLIRSKGKAEKLYPLSTNFNKFNLEFTSPHTGAMRLDAKDGAIMLPAGEYKWLLYSADHIDKDGKKWSFSSGSVMNEPFKVVEGENVLPLCFPFRQRLTACTKGNEVTFDEQILGRSGENVYVYGSTGRFDKPRFSVEDMEGKKVGNGIFEAG